MISWNRNAVAAYAPAMVGWCLALASGLRLEQLRDDRLAQAMLPLLHKGVVASLVLTLACTVVASVLLWRGGHRDRNGIDAGTTAARHPSARTGTAHAGRR
ncbi:hypothetical protein ACK1O1_12105 [Stenotrophomonas maltophilia]|jgi:hypothetical protein|uniref:hypothetical protein n=1 Tax=Stenotrophomonas TaxID=40323 RepID=UPI00201D1986|nr:MULTISPECIES: hypothetical protein [Stenotrophomonas]MBN5024834.1 hypothetical protein [Stenotrophomonas maltophilia]MDH1273902.1 hypothetical protein [Stenotrophomonas sp. GD03937]MDH1485471.1 hypothetical protein [Stenotrophomonas sp. GD03712]MDR2960840.1 hypothetical protein [Stenotrophomonas sp.]UQY96263.1 hypothetical protein LZ605_02555 [Stenotrophomonas maltophilia]